MNPFYKCELGELMSRAKAAFEALTPEEQAAHRREQRISWVYGEAGLRNHPITREQAAAIVDKHDAEKQQQYAAKQDQKTWTAVCDACYIRLECTESIPIGIAPRPCWGCGHYDGRHPVSFSDMRNPAARKIK